MAIRSTLTCLDRLIGVDQGTCTPDTTSTSGLYLSSLPGINIITAGDANDEHANGYAMLDDMIERVIEEEVDNLSVTFSDNFYAHPIIEADTVGSYRDEDDGNDFLAVDSGERGVMFCMKGNNPFKSLRLTRAYAWTNTTGNRTLTITDGDDSSTTKTIALVSGTEVSVDIDYLATHQKVKIGWDTVDISVNDSRMNWKGCVSCPSRTYAGSGNKFVKVGGYEGTNEYQSQTWGLRVEFNIECDWERAVCQLFKNNAQFARLVWYACGMRFAEEVAMSTRFNSLTELRGDDYEAAMERWQKRYDDLRRALGMSISTKIKAMAGDCVFCNSPKIVTLRA